MTIRPIVGILFSARRAEGAAKLIAPTMQPV